MLKLKLQYFGYLIRRVDSLEKTLMLGGIGAEGEGDDRGWDGWMASLTRWTWVWVNSGSWWWTGRPGMLRFTGSQRVGHDWATELNWTDCQEMYHIGKEKLKKVEQEQERRAEYSVKVPQCKGNYFFFTSHVHSNSWFITKYFYIWYLISCSQYLCEVGVIALYLLFPVSIRWLQSVRWAKYLAS